jgi:hypothetical protein
MARIFISYSRLDAELVELYTQELISYGHEIFMDSTLIKAGVDFQKTLTKTGTNAKGSRDQ